MPKFAFQFFFFFFFSFLLLLSTYIVPTVSQEIEEEIDFSYDENSDHGPSKWGEIHEEWGWCGNGTMQSPIDLLNKRVSVVTHLGRLKRSYKPANATLKNRGHDIMLQWEGGAGYIKINGTEYVLNQIHWHSPSEHALDGKSYDLEAHLVHESHDKKVAVVGIMYTIGRPDSFLASMEAHLESVAGTNETEKVVGVVDPRHVKIGSRKYYRYIGSLTIPPCSPNVLWTIVRKVRTVTRKQVSLLQVAVHDESNTNARPIQKLNGRPVKLFRPDERKDD